MLYQATAQKQQGKSIMAVMCIAGVATYNEILRKLAEFKDGFTLWDWTFNNKFPTTLYPSNYAPGMKWNKNLKITIMVQVV